MMAVRVASPEGWQVSVSLVAGSWRSVLGAGGLVLGGAGGGKQVAEGRRWRVSWWVAGGPWRFRERTGGSRLDGGWPCWRE